LPSARLHEALRRPRWEEGRGHIIADARLQLVLTVFIHSLRTGTEGQSRPITRGRGSSSLLHLHKCVARFVSDSWVSCTLLVCWYWPAKLHC